MTAKLSPLGKQRLKLQRKEVKEAVQAFKNQTPFRGEIFQVRQHDYEPCFRLVLNRRTLLTRANHLQATNVETHGHTISSINRVLKHLDIPKTIRLKPKYKGSEHTDGARIKGLPLRMARFSIDDETKELEFMFED